MLLDFSSKVHQNRFDEFIALTQMRRLNEKIWSTPTFPQRWRRTRAELNVPKFQEHSQGLLHSVVLKSISNYLFSPEIQSFFTPPSPTFFLSPQLKEGSIWSNHMTVISPNWMYVTKLNPINIFEVRWSCKRRHFMLLFCLFCLLDFGSHIRWRVGDYSVLRDCFQRCLEDDAVTEFKLGLATCKEML